MVWSDQSLVDATASAVASADSWHNPWNWFDVNGRGGVTPLDVLILVNYINSNPDDSSLPPVSDKPPPYYDVNGDSQCTPQDVLMVVENINARRFGPTIEIAGVPTYGTDGLLTGSISGADASFFHVAPYIYIDGVGWWTKPTVESPVVEIAAEGTFVADVASGGIDNRATIFCAALIPADSTPPVALGGRRIPADLDTVAIDCRQRYGRTVEFAGYTWGVKESPIAVGPGSNRFSDQTSDVFVDQQGLHLTVNFHDGQWWATELVLLDHLGYGTYAFQTNSRLDDLDPNVIFGGFTWDPFGDDESGASPNRELDFEDGRWGQPGDPANAQVVVQPHDHPENKDRYTLPDLSADASLTRFFDWQPDQIEFVAISGHQSPFDYVESDVIHRYAYSHRPDTGHFIPTEGRESFHFNLWLYDASGPAQDLPVEVVITDFGFWKTDP